MSAYAGIGAASDVPESVKNRQIDIGYQMAQKNWLLRSGAAPGSDYNFETGCDLAVGRKQIFLPEKDFQSHPSEYYIQNWPLLEEAQKLAEKYHPNWKSCGDFARRAHTRNVAQILGWTLDDPVDLVFCYTPNGKVEGGTGQAMRIALDLHIPIFNLYIPDVETIIKLL